MEEVVPEYSQFKRKCPVMMMCILVQNKAHSEITEVYSSSESGDAIVFAEPDEDMNLEEILSFAQPDAILQAPSVEEIKCGTYVLIEFLRGVRKKTKFWYVGLCQLGVDDNGEIRVIFLNACVTVCDNNYRRTSLVRPRLVRRSGWFDCSSRACMHRLIDDWPAILFTSSKDEVSIILLGSEDTNNNLNYKNICLAYPLGAPNWNMIEYIEKGIKPSLVDADWFEALILGLDVLKKRATHRTPVIEEVKAAVHNLKGVHFLTYVSTTHSRNQTTAAAVVVVVVVVVVNNNCF
uniref:Ku70/Ku80 N-terminal alpha/beta domain-containing protein n=1 Tax=Timema genevievae TaxID=629358 RepID=A0A7R9JVX0_TIMGE|nr:unnamed protein product [Timema genevievae]